MTGKHARILGWAAVGALVTSAAPARVPGTLNFKYSPARLVTVTLFEPDRRYNPCDFDEWLPAVVTAPQTDAALASLAEPIREGRRNTDLYRLGRTLRAKQLAPYSLLPTSGLFGFESLIFLAIGWQGSNLGYYILAP